jgi:CDP-diacylglycerol--glycerol-3-phosphate 3-phosphatidyltransferase
MTFYARDTGFHSTLNVLLAGLAMVGSVLVSYASARAESLIPKCDVGFLRRPERVVLLIIGALSTHPGSESLFANRMPAVLWILAVGSFWTFAYRVYHTWRELNRVAEPAADDDAAQSFLKTRTHGASPAADASEARGTSAGHADASNTDAGRHGSARRRGETRPRPALTKGE